MQLRILALAFPLAASAGFAACSSDEKSGSGPADGGVDASADGAPNVGADVNVDVDASGNVLTEKSGSRLKLASWVTGDGFRKRFGLYDAQLAKECRAMQATDGVRRCLPDGAATDHFLDDQCTQRVAYWSACAPTPAYAAMYEPGDACAEVTFQRRVFSLKNEIPKPTSLYTNTSQGCVGTGPGDDSFKWAPVDAEVPPATFVAVSEAPLSAAPNLEAIFLESADGLRALERFRDPTRGPCGADVAGDGKTRCLPLLGGKVGVRAGRYADDACTTELANNLGCATFSSAWQYVPGCPAQAKYFTVGAPAPLSDAGVFGKGSGTCAPEGPLSTLTFRALGTEIPPADFAELPSVAASGTSRLRADTRSLPNGAILPTTTVSSSSTNDSVKNVTCNVQRFADGKWRCAPLADYSESYADDACTTPVVTISNTSCRIPTVALRLPTSGCGDPTYFTVTGKRATNVTYRKAAGDTCITESLPNNYDAYDLGPVVSPTEWPEVTIAYE